MNYIYDILINFNENLYNFYDWNTNDNICHIRKIPFFKVDDKVYKDLKENDIVFFSNFLEKIYNKTEVFTNKSVRTIPYAFLISNGVEVVAINIGKKLKKSKLLIDEEYEVLQICERFDFNNIDYELVKNNNHEFFKTRHEIEIKKYINKQLFELYKENNIQKLCYVYYECFNEKEREISKIVKRFNYEMKYNFDFISQKLYKFFKLVQLNK